MRSRGIIHAASDEDLGYQRRQVKRREGLNVDRIRVQPANHVEMPVSARLKAARWRPGKGQRPGPCRHTNCSSAANAAVKSVQTAP